MTATADVAKFAQTLAKTANESQEDDQESSHFESQKPLVVTVSKKKYVHIYITGEKCQIFKIFILKNVPFTLCRWH